MKHALCAALLASGLSPPSPAADPLKAFPPAEPGMRRYVISVPAIEDEQSARVELMVGKTVSTDAANRYFFGGRLETEPIRGWGYERYVLSSLGPLAGTLMAVDPNAPKVERFVALGGEPMLTRYNSRMPIVVYVPSEVEVRYRIWRAEPGVTPAKEN